MNACLRRGLLRSHNSFDNGFTIPNLDSGPWVISLFIYLKTIIFQIINSELKQNFKISIDQKIQRNCRMGDMEGNSFITCV